MSNRDEQQRSPNGPALPQPGPQAADVELLPFQAADDSPAPPAPSDTPRSQGAESHQITAETAAEPTPITALAPPASIPPPPAEQRPPEATAAAPGATPATSAGTAGDLSADTLFEGVDVEQAAQWSETNSAHVLSTVERLEQARNQLIDAQKTRGDTHSGQRDYERALAEAHTLVETAAEQIETLSAQPEAKEARQELVDTYFRLQRLIESYGEAKKTAEHRAVKRRAELKDKELARRVRASAGGPRPPLSRGVKLAIFLSIALVARVGWYFAGESEPTKTFKVERIQLPAGAGSFVQNDRPPTNEQALKGAPRIQMLGLTSSSVGLRASVFAITKKSANIEHTYTWWENDQIFSVEDTGQLPLEKLTPGSTYRVEVKVSDGKMSATATSDPLVFRAKGSDTKP